MQNKLRNKKDATRLKKQIAVHAFVPTNANLKPTYQASKQLSLSAKIININDEIYAETASYSYGKEKYTPAAPRQFFAGLEYSFE